MTRFIIYAQLTKVFELIDNGWFIHLDGSHESLFVGTDKPDLKARDVVKITIEKVEVKLDANA